jgi:hypothetical protein
MPKSQVHKGACNCGAVTFEVTLPNGLKDQRRCDCSICGRRGAIVGSVELAGLKVTALES